MLFDIENTEKLKPGTIKKALTVYHRFMKRAAEVSQGAEERFIDNLSPLMKCFNDRDFSDAIGILESMRTELEILMVRDDEEFELGKIDRILYYDDDEADYDEDVANDDEDDVDEIF